jgi:hypothetical protein
MARKSICEKDYDVATKEATFNFTDGTELVLEVGKLSEEIQTNLMLHGALQKVGDSYAGVEGDVAKGIANAKDVIQGLLAGQWKGEREGGLRIGVLAEAIAKLKNSDVETVRAALTLKEGATEDEKKAHTKKLAELRSHPQIKKAVAEIQLAKANAEAEAAGDVSFSV